MRLSLRSLSLLALAFIPLACHSHPADVAPQPQPLVAQEPAGAVAVAAEPVAEVAPASDATVARLIELGRKENLVQDHLAYLCKEIGPRLTGSTRLQVACEWTQGRFEEYGLTASMEPWGEFPVGFDRGPWKGGMVAPEKLDFEFHTMSWTPGTNGPARGPALAYPTNEEELVALSPKLAGAWLVRPPSRELKLEDGTLVFEKPAQPAREFVTKVQEAMVANGALGEVRGSGGELLVTGGNHQITWNDLPKLVSVRTTKTHHDQLWTRMAKGEAVELEFDIQNTFVEGPVTQYNVIADLVGSEKPDEFVIVCGHLDSWDGAQGTVDNGTGVSTTLEAARLLTRVGAKPKRTIRFILWTGEEQGIFGSEAYAKSHAAELPKISAVLCHDGGTNYLSGLPVTAAMKAQLEGPLAVLTTLDPALPFEFKVVDGLTPVGSDSDVFIPLDVPGLFWEQAGRSDYEHYHHTQHDVFEAAIPEYQRHSAIVAAVGAYQIANLPELVTRKNMRAPSARRMGVQLDGTKVTEVTSDGRAAAAG
ncbi:MAG: M20/M25/M40 family metallo-hydrolase, partial [Planctomycetota bacterium]